MFVTRRLLRGCRFIKGSKIESDVVRVCAIGSEEGKAEKQNLPFSLARARSLSAALLPQPILISCTRSRDEGREAFGLNKS